MYSYNKYVFNYGFYFLLILCLQPKHRNEHFFLQEEQIGVNL